MTPVNPQGPLMVTNTVTAEPQRTMDDLIKEIDAAFAAPRLVGDFMGLPVYVSGKVADETVEIHSGQQILRFRLDHP